MRKLFAISVLSAFALLRGEESEQQRELNALITASSYVTAQNSGLTSIGEKFPALKDRAREAYLKFELSAYGEGYRNAETVIASIYGENLVGLTKLKQAQFDLHQTITGQSKSLSISEDQASAFIDAVNQRALGTFSLPTVGPALLSANPRFRGHPNKELAAGFKQTVSSKGKVKGKGRNIEIDIPASWWVKDGKGPNIISNCRSQLGSGPFCMLFGVQELEVTADGQPITQSRWEATAADLGTGEFKLPSEYQFVSCAAIGIDGRMWAQMIYDKPLEASGKSCLLRQYVYLIPHHRQQIVAWFILEGADKASLDAIGSNQLEIHRQILGTLRVLDEAQHPQFAPPVTTAATQPQALSQVSRIDQKSMLALAMYPVVTPYASTLWSPLGLALGPAAEGHFIWRVLIFLGVAMTPIAMWQYFASRGTTGLVALVPVLSTLRLLDAAELSRRWALLLLVPVAGALALHIMLSVRLVSRQGAGWYVSIVYFFTPAFGLSWLIAAKNAAIRGDRSKPVT